MILATAAVSMRTAMKYRRDWNKNSVTVKLLRKFMPKGSKGYRVYVPIGSPDLNRTVTVPPAVRYALRKAGFVVSDYLAKKCVKIKDKEQKNVFNIGKVIAKDPTAKAAFDNDPQLQNSASEAKFEIVISCHPYDIIGMSTGRDWDRQSCMRLKDFREDHSEGAYSEHLENDVAEGTLVAYAIRSDDRNIQHPLCRCLLKPFIKPNAGAKADIIYRKETKVYGNNVPGFDTALARFVRRLNASAPSGEYDLVEGLYDDGVGGTTQHRRVNIHTAHIDLRHADDLLRTSPEEFPNYVKAYMNHREEERQSPIPRQIITDILDKIELFNIPPKYVRPVAHMILHDNGLRTELWQRVNPMFASGENRPGFGVLFSYEPLRSAFAKRLRTSIAADLITPEALKDAEQVLSFLSPEYAENIKADTSSPERCTRVAIQALKGQREMTPRTFENYPGIANAMRVLVHAARVASRYDVDEFGTLVYKYAGMLKDAPVTDEFEVLKAASDFGEWQLYFARMLEAEKDAPALFGKLVDKTDWHMMTLAVVSVAKFRRVLMNKCPPALVQKRDGTVREIAQEKHRNLEPSVKRDVIALLTRIGLAVEDFHRWAGVAKRHVEYVPFTYSLNTDFMDVILNWNTVVEIYHNYAGQPIPKYDEAQQDMFDKIGTLNGMLTRPLNLPFEYTVKPEYEKAFLEEPTITSVPIDYHKYPDFLSEEIATHISLMEFIGNDMGYSWLGKLEKGRSLAIAARLLMTIVESGATDPIQMRNHIFKYVGREGKYAGVRNVPTIVKELIADGEGKPVYDALVDYLRRFIDFANTYPDIADSSFYTEAIAFYGEQYSEQEIMASMPQIKLAAGAIRDTVERWAVGFANYLKMFTSWEDPAQFDDFRALKQVLEDYETYRKR